MSRSMAMSSEESSESESESIMLILLTELDRFVLSCNEDHIGFWLGDSKIVPLSAMPLLWGILIPRPVIGDASGDDSASVEWCRLVHALAKSRPLDLLGRTDEGEP